PCCALHLNPTEVLSQKPTFWNLAGPSHHSITDHQDRTSTQQIGFHEESIRRLFPLHSGRGRQSRSRGAHVLTALPQHFLPSDLPANVFVHTRGRHSLTCSAVTTSH